MKILCTTILNDNNVLATLPADIYEYEIGSIERAWNNGFCFEYSVFDTEYNGGLVFDNKGALLAYMDDNFLPDDIYDGETDTAIYYYPETDTYYMQEINGNHWYEIEPPDWVDSDIHCNIPYKNLVHITSSNDLEKLKNKDGIK